MNLLENFGVISTVMGVCSSTTKVFSIRCSLLRLSRKTITNVYFPGFAIANSFVSPSSFKTEILSLS